MLHQTCLSKLAQNHRMKHGLNQNTIFSHLFKGTTRGFSVINTYDGPSDCMYQKQTQLLNLATECFSNPLDHSSKLLIAKPEAMCAMVIHLGLVFKRFVPWKVFNTSGNYKKTSLATIGIWKVIHSSWKNCKMFIKFHSASLTFWSMLYEVPNSWKGQLNICHHYLRDCRFFSYHFLRQS